ncbi:arabinose isomerase [candidate division KSB1 bacterium]|nr:L-fucose/L-arabinose isomerase family protein [candidate division KSB1 bacterium]RQW05413.1 MAG: arabinose isomerase [candidate division KSB1 bacterium]
MIQQNPIQRRFELSARIGLFGVGHHVYWQQFANLYDQMVHKLQRFEEKVKSLNVQVINFGIIDNAESAYALIPKLRAGNLDLLFCDMLTYATSSTIGIIFREIQIPLVLVALQPMKALDYSQSSTCMQLLNDDICALPEFASVALRMGKKIPPMIIGTLENDPQTESEIADYCRIAYVLHDLQSARIGHMGHVLEAMLDMHVDPTLLTRTFGCHIVLTEPDDILKHYRKIDDGDVTEYVRCILNFFDTPEPKSDPITRKLTDEDLREAAKVGVALERFIEEKKLDGLAYYYEAEEGSDMRRLVTNLIVGNSLLTSAGFPMCGEADLKTCIAMMIMDRLDMGGSFAEFHPIDFNDGFVLVGHDGPHHLNIAQGNPVLRSLLKYHGKPGSGASVEFKLKEGPITMLGITQKADGQFKFVLAEGESVAGPVPPTGNTNTRGYFKPDVRTFLKRWFAEGPTHHFALGIGHKAETIRRVGEFLKVEAVLISDV